MENETFVRAIQPWQSMEIDCSFFTPQSSWDPSLDHQSYGIHLDPPPLSSSIVSSPAASNSNTPNHPLLPNATSLYVSAPLSSSVAEFSADPGFAERAARFSCLGSRSFNGRSSHQMGDGVTSLEPPYGMISPAKIPRVLSSPSLKPLGARQVKGNNHLQKSGDRAEVASSLEESSISDQKDNGDPRAAAADVNSRKRKAAQKGKAKAAVDKEEDSSPKRCKQNRGNDMDNAEEDDKKVKNDEKKAAEPPKDYIHVRARRGQATDSHSLAERVRREKISERMKLLQDLVPGCNKVIGKALMLDEIINYVQSLQRQVEFLSMKLASVNTSIDFNMDTLMSSEKDIFQSVNSGPNPQMYPPLDSSAFHGQHGSDGTSSHCSVDPLSMGACRSLDAHFPDIQYQSFCGGDLQTIVQMGFVQNSQKDNSDYSLQPLQVQASQLKVEP
ncbi:hypothetical protein SAY86_024855 [Trapa natans]|uniref:BHLH domain-containing protein n=1 Tax=Trapa natans TaxID=22666 RepID=A0AAN7REN1_TRANT|nr:hypothetical protein SAY86_024855 [Trapa natans]